MRKSSKREDFILYIVCSNAHKRRKIASIVTEPRFNSATSTYIPDVAVILTERKKREDMGSLRLHVQPPPSNYYSEDHNPKADIQKVIPLLDVPHETHIFPCRVSGCSPVSLTHENVLSIYESFRHADCQECELNDLRTILPR